MLIGALMSAEAMFSNFTAVSYPESEYVSGFASDMASSFRLTD